MEQYRRERGEQRAFTRVPFMEHVGWASAPGDTASALVRDVSRAGISLELGRYVRPGRVIQVVFERILYRQQPVEFTARIAWCHPATDGRSAFLAGSHVLHDQPATLAAVCEVFYTALESLGSWSPPEHRCTPLADPVTKSSRAG